MVSRRARGLATPATLLVLSVLSTAAGGALLLVDDGPAGCDASSGAADPACLPAEPAPLSADAPAPDAPADGGQDGIEATGGSEATATPDETTACVPGKSSAPAGRDFDGDGVPGQYTRSGHKQVTVHPDGTLTTGPGAYYCWTGGDPDDDGEERLSAVPVAGLPSVSVCVQGTYAWPVKQDNDEDGNAAVYMRQDNDQVKVDADGNVAIIPGPYYCWAGGDLDDDGVDRLPPDRSPPPARSVCIAGDGSQVVRNKDYDGDGDKATYTRGDNVRGYLEADGELRFSPGEYECWTAGDPDDDRANRGQDVYAFGDSITRAVEEGMRLDGGDCYVFSVDDSAGHNMDGHGRSSEWGAAMFSRNTPLTGRNRLFVIEFGQNDRREDRGNLSVEQTVANLDQMYQTALLHSDHAVVLTPVLIDPQATREAWSDWAKPLPVQRAWLQAIEDGLAERGVPFVRTYDLIDSVPGNGVPDGWVAANYVDDVHPDTDSHRLIGQAVADFAAAQGWPH